MLEAAIQGAIDDIKAAGDTGGPRRRDTILEAAIGGLRETYACLRDEALVGTIHAAVEVPNTGNDQLDYEQVRDQVERIARQHQDLDDGE